MHLAGVTSHKYPYRIRDNTNQATNMDEADFPTFNHSPHSANRYATQLLSRFFKRPEQHEESNL